MVVQSQPTPTNGGLERLVAHAPSIQHAWRCPIGCNLLPQPSDVIGRAADSPEGHVQPAPAAEPGLTAQPHFALPARVR